MAILLYVSVFPRHASPPARDFVHLPREFINHALLNYAPNRGTHPSGAFCAASGHPAAIGPEVPEMGLQLLQVSLQSIRLRRFYMPLAGLLQQSQDGIPRPIRKSRDLRIGQFHTARNQGLKRGEGGRVCARGDVSPQPLPQLGELRRGRLYRLLCGLVDLSVKA